MLGQQIRRVMVQTLVFKVNVSCVNFVKNSKASTYNKNKPKKGKVEDTDGIILQKSQTSSKIILGPKGQIQEN